MLVDTIEEWRPIEGTAGNYSVSSWGRVRRDTNGWRHNTYAGYILNPTVNTRPAYLQVGLRMSGRKVTCRVHRLVAETFLGPRPTARYQVNHIDGVKTNNRVSNLEWVTDLENKLHATTHGLMTSYARPFGWTPGNARLTDADVRFIRSSHLTTAALARHLDVGESTVRRVRQGQTWTHVI